MRNAIKRCHYICLFLVTSSMGLLLGGCLMRPAHVPTRHFVLAPIPGNENASTGAPPLFVEIPFVQMPSYLLRDSMVVRKNASEVEYLETCLWAERLDQSFRQTLAQNLSILLASDPYYRSTSKRDPLAVRVSVSVEQFDVDMEGRGTLRAGWRVTDVGTEKLIKNGEARFIRLGPSPRGNPQAIAATLSALTADFSRELLPALLEPTQAGR